MPLTLNTALRLPATEYIATGATKTGIAIHHTVGGSVASSVNWWRNDGQMLGTAYLIDRDGTIHEVFDPTAWAWQFGLRWPQAKKTKFERRFIGIEIASEGGLMEVDGKLYCFDRVSPRTLKPATEAFDYGSRYRGYRYFDRYEPAQVDSLVQLVDELCTRFAIPRRVPRRALDYHGEALADFQGVIGHAMVRQDKSDPLPDESLWQRLERDCGLAPVDTGTMGGLPGGHANGLDPDALARHNKLELDRLNPAAASMVRGLIMELQGSGRSTWIRLRNALAAGHVVEYQVVQGDRGLVPRMARALGFRDVTDTRLEARAV